MIDLNITEYMPKTEIYKLCFELKTMTAPNIFILDKYKYLLIYVKSKI